jgi:hypothetical protein
VIYQSLPYRNVYVKKSFLTGPKNFKWGKDETVHGILVGVKSVFRATPMFEVYFPEYQACYDKTLQCAIFENPETPNEEIRLQDVGWWDCISGDIQIYEKSLFKHGSVKMQNKSGRWFEGKYLWTIDFSPPHINEGIDLSEAQWWSEHKQANFMFDKQTGVLACGPNNKMRYICESLCKEEAKPPFFKVFSGDSWSHEDHGHFMGSAGEDFDYYGELKKNS